MDRLEEIRQRTEAATPGPWEVEKYYHEEPYEEYIKSAAVVATYNDGGKGTITRNDWSNPVETDLDFIAHAREDIPYLLGEVDRLNKMIVGYQDAVMPEFRSQIEALTARAEAAEADLRKCAPCWLCKKKCGIFDALDQRKDGCCPNFEWRGQAAGKGENNA